MFPRAGDRNERGIAYLVAQPVSPRDTSARDEVDEHDRVLHNEAHDEPADPFLGVGEGSKCRVRRELIPEDIGGTEGVEDGECNADAKDGERGPEGEEELPKGQ